jgi:hypothetical protein
MCVLNTRRCVCVCVCVCVDCSDFHMNGCLCMLDLLSVNFPFGSILTPDRLFSLYSLIWHASCKQILSYVRFHVLAAANMKMRAFWNISS